MARAVKPQQVPPQLATPTDLDAHDVEAVCDSLNELVADAFALYVKTKNYHWHVSGSHFRSYHLLFDEQAASILESVDVLAERARKLGGTTIHSIAQVAALKSIADDDDDYVAAEEMVEHLLEDNRHVAHRQRATIELCESHRDTPTANVLQDMLDQTERRIWFLFEASRGDNARNDA
jgi:starvation-inducible DNA-binding protein